MLRLETEVTPLADYTRPSGVDDDWHDGGELFLAGAAKEAEHKRRTHRWLLGLTAAAAAALAIGIAALVLAAGTGNVTPATSSTPAASTSVRRIAFGSCTSYDLRPQPIWTQGVIPSEPDVWIWIGDMAYMDNPLVSCDQVPTYPGCNCTADFMRQPPGACFAGNVEHARLRMMHQVHMPEYVAFLEYMCPGLAAGSGPFPPVGSDPRQCPRPIFGVYDDHDSGWNNGNKRNPYKWEIKGIYLDGIGEPSDSQRRSQMDGLQAHYVLGAGSSSIDLVLLDERYFRDTLPCSARRARCEGVLASGKPEEEFAWCQDFLGPSRQHSAWPIVCEPSWEEFASEQLLLMPDNITVLRNTAEVWSSQQASMLYRLLQGSSSPLCEVLGMQQRRWLRRTLLSGSAPLTVVASGSVFAGGVGHYESDGSTCSGDDWLCFMRADINMLHTLANASQGCVVAIVGDYHYSDLKAILPGPDHKYASILGTASLRRPIYQVMSSGMTESTAHHVSGVCEGSFRQDYVGLRPLGNCSIVTAPAFGFVEVDWAARRVLLQIRDGATGQVAKGVDGARQELQIALDTCELLPAG